MSPIMFWMFLLLGFFTSNLHITVTGAHQIGVCFGRVADNLPSVQEVVAFYKSNGITRMRIYDPHQETLQALRGSGIELLLGVPNEDIQSLATDQTVAQNWVQNNVIAYSPDVSFRYIAVGNELSPVDSPAQFVLQAMQNINHVLISANLGHIKVSTSINGVVLGQSYPPSAGQFSDQAISYINPIVQFLVSTESPLLANIYPYFSYIGEPQSISLAYALFTSPGIVVQDGSFGYQNLFDATLDAYYAALEKLGAPNVTVVVSESGWPSDGGPAATFDNANTYYTNLVNHVDGSTPRRPGQAIETYLFAMFDEDQKGPAESERHFGLFTPNEQPKYQINFGS